MVFIRAYSIQDILRNINRSLTWYDIVSVALLFVLALSLFLFLKKEESARYGNLEYIENTAEITDRTNATSKIFASKNGKTYTYAWCQGASRIKEANKIFFTNEETAKRSGRTLSKLCQ